MTTVQPFELHVPDDVLVDLRARLARTRLLHDSPRKPASGMSAAYLRELVDSWIEWDWRAREAWLNRHPQFIAQIDDAAVRVLAGLWPERCTMLNCPRWLELWLRRVRNGHSAPS